MNYKTPSLPRINIVTELIEIYKDHYIRYQIENLVKTSRILYELCKKNDIQNSIIIDHLKVISFFYIKNYLFFENSLNSEFLLFDSLLSKCNTYFSSEEFSFVTNKLTRILEFSRDEFNNGRTYYSKKYSLLSIKKERLIELLELEKNPLDKLGKVQVVAIMGRGLIDATLFACIMNTTFHLCRYSTNQASDLVPHSFSFEYNMLQSEQKILLVDGHLESGHTLITVSEWYKSRGFAKVYAAIGIATSTKQIDGLEPIPINTSSNHSEINSLGKLFKCTNNNESSIFEKRYILYLVGKPGVGKTLVYKHLREKYGISGYKWGKYARSVLSNYYDGLTFSSFTKLTLDEEEGDKLLVARYFTCNSGILANSSRIVQIDGIKSVEQINYLTSITGREPIIFFVKRDEQDRLNAIVARNDFDDVFDYERMCLLDKIATDWSYIKNNFEINTSNFSDATIDNHMNILFGNLEKLIN